MLQSWSNNKRELKTELYIFLFVSFIHSFYHENAPDEIHDLLDFEQWQNAHLSWNGPHIKKGMRTKSILYKYRISRFTVPVRRNGNNSTESYGKHESSRRTNFVRKKKS